MNVDIGSFLVDCVFGLLFLDCGSQEAFCLDKGDRFLHTTRYRSPSR